MEGRETGTRGLEKAAAYIIDQFKNIGLQQIPGTENYQQFYPLQKEILTDARLTIGKYKTRYGVDFSMWAAGVPKGKFQANEIVFVGYGINDSVYDDYKNIDVKGKAVIFFNGSPEVYDRHYMDASGKLSRRHIFSIFRKLEIAKKMGASAAFEINMLKFPSSGKAVLPATDIIQPRKEPPALLMHAYLSIDAARKINGFAADSLQAMAIKRLSFSVSNVSIPVKIKLSCKKKIEKISSSNVAGMIEGTDKKDEYIFLTAHYDHLGIRNGKVYNGADDDGSGTVALIEMARVFQQAKKDGKGCRRSIVFMAFSGEEKGLWGSNFYAEHPFVSLEKTSVDLNTDMIGRIDTERKTADTLNYIYVVGHDKISSDLPIISESVNGRYTQLIFDYKFDDPNDPHRIYFRSDHYHFARKGVPVLFFYDGMLTSDYHQPTDDIEHINWPLYQKRTQLIFYTAWEMANTEKMLVRDKPVPTATR
jgi:hypothetical protein